MQVFRWSEPELVRGLMQRAEVGIDGDHAAIEIYVVVLQSRDLVPMSGRQRLVALAEV